MAVQGPYMLVPPDEYDRLKERVEFLERVVEGSVGNRAAAEEFIAAFDLSRANEWGHVSWCIGEALEAKQVFLR